MSRASGVLVAVAALVSSLAATLQSPAPSPNATPKPVDSRRTVTCALSNIGYSGWCRVTETIPKGGTAGSVCRSVLACLNDVRCTKTYCNGTTIRSGWRLESVKRN